MKLTFYTTNLDAVDLRPTASTRDWMDQTPESFAYRCLPLNIANAHGWSFHLKKSFSVRWDGGQGMDSLRFTTYDDISDTCVSVFGSGIVTFYIHGLFQTKPGWCLYAGGPPNNPKDGIAPLTGFIETDWSPYSFTMNWKLTRPDHEVTFEAGEPFCTIFPVQKNLFETIEPEIRPLSDNPELQKDHGIWSAARSKFNKDLANHEDDAVKEKWQKAYYRGHMPDQGKGCPDHITKLRLQKFKKPK